MSQDDRSSLPTSVEALQQMVLRMQQEIATAQQEVVQQKQVNAELSVTVQSQTERLAKNERTIRDLIAALKGKTRERLDPDQLLLFEIGELEALIEEAAASGDGDETQEAKLASKKKTKRGHGRRIIPDDLPREEVVHELPEDERRCPHDGKPMSLIRYETSEQLDSNRRS